MSKRFITKHAEPTIDDTPCKAVQRVINVFPSSTPVTLKIKVPLSDNDQRDSFSESQGSSLGIGPSLERSSHRDGQGGGCDQRGEEDGLKHDNGIRGKEGCAPVLLEERNATMAFTLLIYLSTTARNVRALPMGARHRCTENRNVEKSS